MLQVNKQVVYGIAVNATTGCAHYNSHLDIIAIKFACCDHYYSCYLCHEAMADHSSVKWQAKDMDKKAILCGRCTGEMTIQEYLSCNNVCVHCAACLNPGCKLHWNVYFEQNCLEPV